MKTVLVTGAAGFIGLHLVKKLKSQNLDVHCVVKSEPRSQWGRFILNGTTIHRVDLLDTDGLKNTLSEVRPDTVFHLAAYTIVERSFENAHKCIQNNIQGTVNMLNATEDSGCKCFVNTSTNEVYGHNVVPFKETQEPDPISPYGVSKYSAEIFCRVFHETHGIPVVNVRPFNPYGEYQTCNRIIPEVIVSCLLKKDIKTTGGKQTRELNYIEDTIDGFIKVANTKKAIGETINIGCGIGYPIKTVVKKISAMLGNPVKLNFGALPYRKNEIWKMYCSNAKAKKLLKWKPRYSLDEGLKKTVLWYSKLSTEDLKMLYNVVK